ncbi:glycosyltransferase family 9 protein [Limobrevibacterium gyesilva]|uniref:ADP-heptose:LPS heptosyltransferase n=1 Tax=Limobrevibacterium gyesilva TaxID=2991712 RepID=A0AA41YVT1_9PROT|nr:glycosyltransferase family 9 protein [Limobrevibacterium gyesilva]MCW3477325.1 hypothetical protein [Limobrevibacterium gyesilva]
MTGATDVAILNGFGRTLGDSIIGLQALHAARTLGAIPGKPVLFRLPGLSPLIEAVYAAAADLAEVRELPWTDATPERPFTPAAAFARVIDIRDFAFDPAFRGAPMIDYFLRHLGVAPAGVPPALKRNAWLAPRVTLPPQPAAGHVLVCPRTANPMRDMPDAVHAHILDWLGTHTGAPVLTQAMLPPAGSLAELCGLVAAARLVVAADTAMVHLADAFRVPCLAFFTTHRPEWRVRDYPLCTPVHRPAPGLPPAIEFVRGPDDVAAAQAAWGPGLAWLDPVLAAAWRRSENP